MGKLYIRYQLDVADSEVVEVRDVNCLLKDKKELYIQKDHLSAKLDICRCVGGCVCVGGSFKAEKYKSQAVVRVLIILSLMQ